MSNYKTKAQIYNDKMEEIWETARENGSIKTTKRNFNPFLLHKLQSAGGLSIEKSDQVLRMVETLGLYKEDTKKQDLINRIGEILDEPYLSRILALII